VLGDRLFGFETEYAIRFTPRSGAVPTRQEIADAVLDGVRATVRTRDAQPLDINIKPVVHLQNGGRVHFEHSPGNLTSGLIEGATPECTSPYEAVAYQRALDGLLLDALPAAEDRLAAVGFPGRIGLLKNSRDADGERYGPQESYEVEAAPGWRRIGWVVGFGALVPAFSLQLLVVVVAMLIGVLCRGLLFGEIPTPQRLEGWLRWMLRPIVAVSLWHVDFWGFRQYRRLMTAFLVSRQVVTGAGWVDEDGAFRLSEKGLATARLTRRRIDEGIGVIFESGHLIKDLFVTSLMPWRGTMRRLIRRRQRMQLGLSDANICQEAELLKAGTTALVVELVARGRVGHAPRFADPIAVLHALSDPSLSTQVTDRRGTTWTAVSLQRWYQEQAAKMLEESVTVMPEWVAVVRTWGRVLDDLERAPEALVGRVDWVTKQLLLDGVADEGWEIQKKVDLRYHELGDGYGAALLASLGRDPVVDEATVTRARSEPPSRGPARLRASLLEELEGVEDVEIAWDQVRIKTEGGAKVIRLDDWRDR
jgi:proteasome accessory factor A